MNLIAMVVGYAVIGTAATALLLMGATWVAFQVSDWLNRTMEAE